MFKISIIMSIYNTEKYLEEAIESVIAQTIGFQDNIQMVLVNNATQDRAGEICLRYKKKYPKNIHYVELKENRGVSGGRNAGIEFATGETINFMDSDDKWAPEALERLYEFLKNHEDIVDFVDARSRKFDAEDGYLGVDYKYDGGTRIVDITKESNAKQFVVNSCLMKRQVMEDGHKFDEKTRFAEDVKFINEILLDKCKYGLVKEAMYLYRIRQSGNSQVQSMKKSKDWYIGAVKESYMGLVELSIRKYAQIIPYIQYLIHSELRERLPLPSNIEFLDEKENIWYREKIIYLLKGIKDEVILSDEWTSHGFKEYELLLKYNPEALSKSYMSGDELCFSLYHKREVWKNNNVRPLHQYLFPFSQVKRGIDIYIYGGGDIGKQYLHQLKKSGYCNVIAVIDKSGKCDFSDVTTYKPDDIEYYKDMVVVVSVFNEVFAEEIKRYLQRKGVEKRNIIWDIISLY